MTPKIMSLSHEVYTVIDVIEKGYHKIIYARNIIFANGIQLTRDIQIYQAQNHNLLSECPSIDSTGGMGDFQKFEFSKIPLSLPRVATMARKESSKME
jgi:uncharacterized protein with ACT and thioredoxin-like domain